MQLSLHEVAVKKSVLVPVGNRRVVVQPVTTQPELTPIPNSNNSISMTKRKNTSRNSSARL